MGGIVLGNIEASQSIKVLATSAVIGDIVSHKVQVEQNAIIHGHFISIKDEQKFLKISDEYLQALAIKQKVSL